METFFSFSYFGYLKWLDLRESIHTLGRSGPWLSAKGLNLGVGVEVTLLVCLPPQMSGPARKVRKALVLDPWGKDCLHVELFEDPLNTAQVGLTQGPFLLALLRFRGSTPEIHPPIIAERCRLIDSRIARSFLKE